MPKAIFASENNHLIRKLPMKSMTLDRSLSQQSPLAMQTPQQGKMLVVIDPGVEDPQRLAAGVQPGAEVFILDPNRDGVEQITQALKESADVASVHLVSHGFPGGIKLGTTELSLDNLDRYADILQTWSKTLTGASLLLYGCQVALGEAGCRFIDRLQQLTKANLAASTQKVGSAEQGGSWSLDYQVGQVLDKLAFLPRVRETYSGVFDPELSVTASSDEVEEGENITFNITATGDELPAEGLLISTSSIFPEGDQFDYNVVEFEGDANFSGLEYTEFVVTPEGEDSVVWTVTEPEASITLPIFDDIIAEPDEEFTLEVLPGEEYTVDSDASSATTTIIDEVEDGEGPTVSFSISEPTEFTESEGGTITATFTVDGEIPEGGLEVAVDSDVPGFIGDFALFDEEGNPLFEATGIEGVPTNNTFDASGFSVVLSENTATLSVDIFQDGPNEGLEEATFTLLNGEEYEVDPEASEATITIDDGDDGLFFGTEEADTFQAGGSLILEYNATNDTVFAAAGDDLIDSSTGGDNRLYGQSGNDTFYLGSGDFASGDEGDDIFYALGQRGTFVGGEGADQFWLVSGELEFTYPTIADFELGTDVIGIGGTDLSFEDLNLVQQGTSTEVRAPGDEFEEYIGVIAGITPDQLSASDFVFA